MSDHRVPDPARGRRERRRACAELVLDGVAAFGVIPWAVIGIAAGIDPPLDGLDVLVIAMVGMVGVAAMVGVLLDAAWQVHVIRQWTRRRKLAEQIIQEGVDSGELVRLAGGRLIEADRHDPDVHGPAVTR